MCVCVCVRVWETVRPHVFQCVAVYMCFGSAVCGCVAIPRCICTSMHACVHVCRCMDLCVCAGVVAGSVSVFGCAAQEYVCANVCLPQCLHPVISTQT